MKGCYGVFYFRVATANDREGILLWFRSHRFLRMRCIARSGPLEDFGPAAPYGARTVKSLMHFWTGCGFFRHVLEPGHRRNDSSGAFKHRACFGTDRANLRATAFFETGDT